MDSFEIVKQLEVELHQPMVRSDAERVSTLLHKSFMECGRSGRFYKRNEILEELSKEEPGVTVWAQDFVAAAAETFFCASVNSDVMQAVVA